MLKLGKLGLFDAENPPDGVWGEFAPGMKVRVRKLTGEVVKGIRKKYVTTTMEVDTKTRKMVPIEHVDNEQYDDALTNYLIQDFSNNFVGDDDKPLPVDLDSKKRMLNYLPLSDWVWAFAQAMDTTEADLKN